MAKALRAPKRKMGKKKAARKKASGSKKSSKRSSSPKLPAWKELVAMLAAARYTDKMTILSRLRSLGYDYDTNSVSYVMTAARKHGHICVYSSEHGYTAIPTGDEAYVDIRKRRKVAAAWLKNARAVIEYVKANMASLTAAMDPKDAANLKREVAYNDAAIQSLDQIRVTNGLQ